MNSRHDMRHSRRSGEIYNMRRTHGNQPMENLWLRRTPYLYVYFYQTLPTTSMGNVFEISATTHPPRPSDTPPPSKKRTRCWTSMFKPRQIVAIIIIVNLLMLI